MADEFDMKMFETTAAKCEMRICWQKRKNTENEKNQRMNTT